MWYIYCRASCRIRLNTYAVFARMVPVHLKVVFQQMHCRNIACTEMQSATSATFGLFGREFPQVRRHRQGTLSPICHRVKHHAFPTSRLMPSTVAPTCLKRFAVSSTVSL